jgi:dienelactone hydrolase
MAFPRSWLVWGGLTLAVAAGLGSPDSDAAVRTEVVEYRHGGAVLEGYLAYDDAQAGPRPAVLVVHEWMGLGPYAKRRAEQLAQLGYLAFAADMYGKGVRAKDHDEAAKLAGIYRSDRQLMRGRILAALDVLRAQPMADQRRIAAIGYCFGGTTVLELARSGADVLGVVSFHGGLDTPSPAEPRRVKARVVVLHGAEDRFVPPEQVAAFEEEMRRAGVNYRLIKYPGAVHSFTVPEAGQDPSTGMAYDEEADRQSWEAMREFFSELFAESEMQHLG